MPGYQHIVASNRRPTRRLLPSRKPLQPRSSDLETFLQLMKRATLLRSGIPALIVALVLGLSFLVPASASDQKHTKPPACGYGYGDKDNDENDDHGDRGGGSQFTSAGGQQSAAGAATEAREKSKGDNDCNEDEGEDDDHGDGGGGGGGGGEGHDHQGRLGSN